MICKICNYFEDDRKKFSRHLQFKHQISSEEYTVKYLFDGFRTKCCECQNDTRYHSYSFKKYCKKHANIARKKSCAIIGKLFAWNKGLTKETDERIKRQAENMIGKKNHFYGKRHKEESLKKIKKDKMLSREEFYNRINKRDGELIPVDIFYDDYFSRAKQYFKFKCIKCGFVNEKTLQAFERGSRCKKCFPDYISSKPEQEIEEFIKSLGIQNIVRNSREIISPKELDIYLPDYNFAIEYNGLYWHSEEDKPKDYHLQKTKLCLEQGIKLFHIFSDEWKNKQDIVKSMIRHRLHMSEKIYARNCEVKEIDKKQGKQFFLESHISGDNNAKNYYGLIYNNEVVACLSIKVPIQKKYGKCLEIARFATKKNISAVGGFSKLFKLVKEKAILEQYEKIISYADKRFGEGTVYLKNGFEFLGKTSSPDYWYTSGEKREFRFKYRAQNGLSEKEYAKKCGVWRIYGCSSNIYLLNLD